MRTILVLDNIRSLNNVGSLMRVCDGLGVGQIFTLGLTPHPKQLGDRRLPHVVKRVDSQLAKTALGAQLTLKVRHFNSEAELIDYLRSEKLFLLCLEQTKDAVDLASVNNRPSDNIALVLGNEIDGVSQTLLSAADLVLQIAMDGHKSSLNVATAGAIALFHLRNISN